METVNNILVKNNYELIDSSNNIFIYKNITYPFGNILIEISDEIKIIIKQFYNGTHIKVFDDVNNALNYIDKFILSGNSEFIENRGIHTKEILEDKLNPILLRYMKPLGFERFNIRAEGYKVFYDLVSDNDVISFESKRNCHMFIDVGCDIYYELLNMLDVKDIDVELIHKNKL